MLHHGTVKHVCVSAQLHCRGVLIATVSHEAATEMVDLACLCFARLTEHTDVGAANRSICVHSCISAMDCCTHCQLSEVQRSRSQPLQSV